jgi:hypothetical protein
VLYLAEPRDCKENGPRTFWLIEFWCLMINTIRELISFSSGYVCSSQDARITWTKELRKATPQKKTLRRYKKSPRNGGVLPSECPVPTPDCPVHQGTAAQRLVPGGTQREDHRTVRWHTGLSGVESLRRQLSTFRTRGVPGSTSKLSPRAPAQMGWRETEREGGKRSQRETGVQRRNPRPSCLSRAQVGCACSRELQASTREGASGLTRAPSRPSPCGQPSVRGPWTFLL